LILGTSKGTPDATLALTLLLLTRLAKDGDVSGMEAPASLTNLN